MSTWYNPEHSPKSFRRSRNMKQMAQALASEEGSCTSHSALGASLPLMLEACHKAGKSFVLRGIAVEGRIRGYCLTTKEDEIR